MYQHEMEDREMGSRDTANQTAVSFLRASYRRKTIYLTKVYVYVKMKAENHMDLKIR